MTDENSDKPEGQYHSFRRFRNRAISTDVLVTEREVSLARLLLFLCDTALNSDDQAYIDLYNEVKPIAESVLRRRPDGT